MKRIFMGLTAIALLCMTSCNNEDVITNQGETGDTPVTFGMYAKKATTYAEIATIDFVKTSGFGVFGYYTGTTDFASWTETEPNFMNNQKVTYDGSNWTYSPLKYWPNDVTSKNERGKLSFFAYCPYKDGMKMTTGINFTVENDIKKEIDLLWGATSDTLSYVNLTKPATTTDKIKFYFNHALSRVAFDVKLADDILNHVNATNGKTWVTIDSLEFGGDVVAATPEGAMDGTIYTTGILNPYVATASQEIWTSKSGSQVLILNSDDFSNTGAFGEDAGQAAFSATISNTSDSYLMIIPQDFSTTKTSFRIKYTVHTEDSSLAGGVSAIQNKAVKEVSLNFKRGKAYKYIITIGLTSVKFDAQMSDWVDAGSSDVNVN